MASKSKTDSPTKPSLPKGKPSSPQAKPSSPQAKPSSPQAKPSSPQAKPSSPQAKPSSPKSPPKTSSSTMADAYTPSPIALLVYHTLGSVFLPSDADIIQIGKILGGAEDIPTIKRKNTYLVWTPRRAVKGSGPNRDLKSPKGGYWYSRGGKIPIVENKMVVGYYRVLKFYEGGSGGRGGEVTDWCMREFFITEGSGTDFVICTVVFENTENTKFLKAFNEAGKVLERNATASRGTKLETDRAVSKGGKHALKGKGLVNERPVVLESTGGASFNIQTRSQNKKTTGTSGMVDDSLKSHVMETRSKKRGGTSGTVKTSTAPVIVPVPVQAPLVVPPGVPLQVPVLPVQAPPELARPVETDVERAVGRELGLSAAEREFMEPEDYYNLRRP